MRVDGPEGGCHGGSGREVGRGWVSGVGDSKRSGAHTREFAFRRDGRRERRVSWGGKGAEGRTAGLWSMGLRY